MRKRIGTMLLLFAFSLCCLVSCTGRREVTYYQYFDTVISLCAEDLGREDFERVAQAAEAEIAKHHRLFDIYHEYAGVNNLCSVNKTALTGVPVPIERELFDFLSEGKALYTLTGGHMNIMLGAVTSLWNTARANADEGAAALPTEAALAEAKKHISIDSLVLDEEGLTAYISDPLASLDVGAFGKGYAAERVAESLQTMGISEGFVLDFGGNLRVLGGNKQGDAFTSGILDPFASEQGAYAMLVPLRDASLVTSGSYFRYFEIDGKRYHHLIDPETAKPSDRFVSVSVWGKDSGLCDALSTALFVMDRAEGEALIESLAGYEAVWITADGQVFKTPDLTPV